MISQAEIVLTLALTKGYSMIPSSTQHANLINNPQAQQLQISNEDITLIDEL
ncbi:hypothetical protein F0Z19_3850 [Vibrio cyclitrophicus]|nr:hypothetical protein F0Z19_3850 [Vibrio cyclitrophicus]